LAVEKEVVLNVLNGFHLIELGMAKLPFNWPIGLKILQINTPKSYKRRGDISISILKHTNQATYLDRLTSN